MDPTPGHDHRPYQFSIPELPEGFDVRPVHDGTGERCIIVSCTRCKWWRRSYDPEDAVEAARSHRWKHLGRGP